MAGITQKIRPTEVDDMPEAGEIFEIDAIDRDGLMIRSDGTFVRMLEVSPRNPSLLSVEEAQAVSATYAQMLGRLRTGQSIQFILDSRPVHVEQVLKSARQEVERVAGPAPTNAQLAKEKTAIERDRWLMFGAMSESITQRSDGDGAVEMRAYLVLPYKPSSEAGGLGLRDMIPGLRSSEKDYKERERSAHERGANESRNHAESIRAEIEGLGIPARRMNGEEVAQYLWARFNPTQADARRAHGRRALRGEVLSDITDHTSIKRARKAAKNLRDSICKSPLDFESSPTWGEVDKDKVQTVYVAGTAEHTYFGWVMNPAVTKSNFTLSVFIEAMDRQKERGRIKRDYRQTFSLNRASEQKGRVPDYDRYTKEGEHESALHALSSRARENVYRVSIYQTIRARGPEPDLEQLAASVDFVTTEIEQSLSTTVRQGEHEQLDLWRSTLPFGVDYHGVKRRYFSANAADMVPLIGTACGSPKGIPFAHAEPTKNLVRLDPYDRTHANQTGVIAGASGSGKTMLAQMIIARMVMNGAQADVIDRAGHFETLVSAFHGAQAVNLGAEGSDYAINPWDVPDPGKVSREKVAFLIALHVSMMGQEGLTNLEKAKLGEAIRSVYVRAAVKDTRASGEVVVPRERELLIELEQMAELEQGAGAAETAAVLRTLKARLGEFANDGSYAYLLDRMTTVPRNAPLCVFDTRKVPEAVIAPVMFVVTEFVKERIERRRLEQAELAAQPDAPMTAGKSILFIDEAWYLMTSTETGEYLNDLARRARHLGLFLLVSSQQLSDFNTPHGLALLQNSTQQFLLRQLPREIPFIQQALQLTDEEAKLLRLLRTKKGEYAEMFWVNGVRGRGKLSVGVGALEYWLYTSEPHRDVPKRDQAIDESGGNVWKALRYLADYAPIETESDSVAA
ncbi:MAG: hypothetical protein J0H98_07105 [Solirubrobacterales bacterium]|nr:hypothetical protein [Solirubrobacterales bacterium]